MAWSRHFPGCSNFFFKALAAAPRVSILINNSLNNIAKDILNIDGKYYYPHNFINKYNLFYEGSVPDIKFFENTDVFLKFLDYYLKSSPNANINNWSLKNETLKYCINDCISLYEVLIKFNQFILILNYKKLIYTYFNAFLNPLIFIYFWTYECLRSLHKTLWKLYKFPNHTRSYSNSFRNFKCFLLN